MTRIAILWSHLSGYLNASLLELKRRDVSLLVSAYTQSAQAPFSGEMFRWLADENYLGWHDGVVDAARLVSELEAFRPDIILVSGWRQSAYLRAARHFSGRALRVLCFDTQWLGTPRQWAGLLLIRFWLKPIFERAFVPGERQFQMATRLGFPPTNVIQGLCAPDSNGITGMAPEVMSRQPQFLYVGRLSHEKGISVLAEAYRIYRGCVDNPWRLVVVGSGPLSEILHGQAGVEMRGFVQPEFLPHALYQSSCLVVPSVIEAWGVQLSEGATAGLPIIATTACGSAVHLVRHGFNGYLVAPEDSAGLAEAMRAIHHCKHLERFSVNSQRLAGQYTPAIWAENVIQSCNRGAP